MAQILNYTTDLILEFWTSSPQSSKYWTVNVSSDQVSNVLSQSL